MRRFDANVVVHRIPKPLLAAEVSLRRLNAHMTEQKLDLLKFPSSLMAQTRTCAVKIVRSNILQPTF
jgi:hypothetical protein